MKRLVLSLIVFLFIAVNAVAEATCTLTPSVLNNVICFGTCTGSATVSVSGGTPPYTYMWSPGGQTGATATGLCAGTYTVSVSSIGCSSSVPVSITQPASCLVQAYTVNNVSCFNGNNGCAVISTTCGPAPYAYVWNTSPPQTTATACGLSAGSYTATVTNANGCSYVTVATITQPPVLNAIASNNSVLCYGMNNGIAWVTPSGGFGSYWYAWSPAGGTGQTASNLVAGCYTVTVTDANGCTRTATTCVTQPTPITATAQVVSNITCFGQCNGVIYLQVSGGSPGYTYVWSPTGQTGQTITGLCAGAYAATVIDSHGCTATTNVVNITQPPPLSLSLSSTNASCSTCNNGSATATAGGGVSPYAYLWSTSATAPSISNLLPGNYSCCITDANGCTTCGFVTVNYSCAPPSVQANHITFSNVTTNSATVSWTNGNGSRRVVKIKTSNTFTAPANGSDPAANTVYAGGEQVVYNGTGNTVTVTGLSSNTAYWFRVYEASCSSVNSSYYTVAASGNPRVILTQPSTNPNRPEEISESTEADFIVYPNPAHNILNIECKMENAELKMYDMTGRIVYEEQIRNLQSEIRNSFSPGIYVIRVQSGENISQQKVVVE